MKFGRFPVPSIRSDMGLSRSWDTAQNGYVNMEHDDPPLGFGGSFESMAGLSVTTDDVL